MGRSAEPQQQTCKVCGQADKFNFHVPDKVWKTVVPPPYCERVVCLVSGGNLDLETLKAVL